MYEELNFLGRKIFANKATDQGINLQNTPTARVALCQKNKTNTPIKKWVEDLSRHLFKEGIRWSKSTWKCSTPLIIRKTQIKTTVSYHLTPIRMTIIMKSTNNTCCREGGERGNPLSCWWECKSAQPLWRTVWRFLKNLKSELPYDPAVPTAGHISGANHISGENPKRYMKPNVHWSTICNSQDMGTT